MSAPEFVTNDGGRAEAGFKGEARDCVVRAIAIATDLPYMQVYSDLAERNAEKGDAKTAREGTNRKIYQPYLEALGWAWRPTMGIGTGCTMHLRADDLPPGTVICKVTKHIVCVIDGVIHDTHDPSRDGTRCVYGYFYKDEGQRGLWGS